MARTTTVTTTEVWRNTTPGVRWFLRANSRGVMEDAIVRGHQVFTIDVDDRRFNQERAATKEQDLFRNGTFVLSRAAKETVEDEIESPQSLTDEEIADLVMTLMHGDIDVDKKLAEITFPNTLARMAAVMAIEDATQSLMDKTLARMYQIEGTHPNERTVVTSPSKE